ncbi:ABC transporter, ATP-binding protein [Propionibacterium acidifaciens F0233]|uniref:ABC transporter, ATP-binding protein n=1 Tax=Propionibacterium acidifaciens F0233 TaxID=553198 RepID=U2RXZ0_9ACTN|nr:ATP-binding cassette domain-containing protein [Propionibacterium acidifaciens]AYW77413.1 ATP-binding cassette domain-containing protein [Propionibacterium acidifaciens]ERK55462.1 ABC transporter, ATP-binding protein [Propionibacterium acidifaciens F0233]
MIEEAPQIEHAILEVLDIHKSFGRGNRRTEVLKGLTFNVLEHQVVSLLGANGAGKTTLVNIASTLLLPSSGSVRVCGDDVVRAPRRVRENISLTGQFAAVDGELSGRENLIFFARLHGMGHSQARARADDLLKQFRLADAAAQRVSKYSGGMRRRLDIAASLIVEPRLLFLDEPTTGLDPLSRRELWETVEGLRDRGVAILLTTQYLDEAERLSDDIILIREGRKVLQGPPVDLRQQFGKPVCSITFDSAQEAYRAATELLPGAVALGVEKFTVEGLALSFTAARGADDLTDALDIMRREGVEVQSAALNPPSLDDVFLGMAFTKDEASEASGGPALQEARGES